MGRETAHDRAPLYLAVTRPSPPLHRYTASTPGVRNGDRQRVRLGVPGVVYPWCTPVVYRDPWCTPVVYRDPLVYLGPG